MCECSSVQSGSADCIEMSAAAAAAAVVFIQFWSLRGSGKVPGIIISLA